VPDPPALASASVFSAAGVRVTETSLEIDNPEGLAWDEFARVGEFLGSLGRAYCWWVGDLLNHGEDIFGEEFAQIEAALPHTPHTLANYRSVAARIPRTRRRRSLSFSVHAEVAYLPPRERDEWLDKAERYDWKREEMRSARQQARMMDSGSVDDVVVTGKRDERESRPEERSGGAPALTQGEPVPSLDVDVCPHCGRPY
jgi:hypothetical protein